MWVCRSVSGVSVPGGHVSCRVPFEALRILTAVWREWVWPGFSRSVSSATLPVKPLTRQTCDNESSIEFSSLCSAPFSLPKHRVFYPGPQSPGRSIPAAQTERSGRKSSALFSPFHVFYWISFLNVSRLGESLMPGIIILMLRFLWRELFELLRDFWSLMQGFLFEYTSEWPSQHLWCEKYYGSRTLCSLQWRKCVFYGIIRNVILYSFFFFSSNVADMHRYLPPQSVCGLLYWFPVV